MEWKKVESTKCDRYFPEKDKMLAIGDETEGRYIDRNDNVGQNNSTLFILENEAKMTIGVWGGTVLNGRFDKIAKGKMVKVVYLGEKPSPTRKGKNYKDWDVFEGILTPEEHEEKLPF